MGALVFTLRIFAWPYIIRVKHKHNDAGEHTGPPAACARALPMVLDPACTNATSAEGWLIIGAWVVTAVILAFALVPIIERAKKCLDFVATAYGIHFVVASIYAHKLPNTVAFYCTQIFCIVLSAVLGEWLCLSRELQEIPIAAPPSELLPLTSEPAGEAPAYGGRRSPFGGAVRATAERRSAAHSGSGYRHSSRGGRAARARHASTSRRRRSICYSCDCTKMVRPRAAMRSCHRLPRGAVWGSSPAAQRCLAFAPKLGCSSP